MRAGATKRRDYRRKTIRCNENDGGQCEEDRADCREACAFLSAPARTLAMECVATIRTCILQIMSAVPLGREIAFKNPSVRRVTGAAADPSMAADVGTRSNERTSEAFLPVCPPLVAIRR
ncbi:hypothetical protein KM043_016652 [Ampulex compressa]|nr:hypothetical protein KM043_016652 [Ampulex compressa]